MDNTEPTKTAEDFAREYKALCDKMSFQIMGVPEWKPTNHGTFELGVQLVVTKAPESGGLR